MSGPPHTKHWDEGRGTIGAGPTGEGARSGKGGGGTTGAGGLGAGTGAGAAVGGAEGEGAAGGGAGRAAGGGLTGGLSGASASLRRRRKRKTDIVGFRRNDRLYVCRTGPRAPFSESGPTQHVAATPSDRLRALGIELPPPPAPAGTYSPVVVHGGLAWVAGQIVLDRGTVVRPGLVDRDVPLDVARDLARRATLQALSALAASLGSIDRVERFLRVTVYVAVSPGFERPHEVANGATDLLGELYGEAGRPTRVTVGVAALPLNAAVEVDVLAATR